MKNVELREEEKQELIIIHKTIKDKKSSDRIKAILMLNDGYRCAEIGRVVLLEERTIRRWKEDYMRRRSITKYIFNECRGRESKLSKSEQETVASYVEKTLICDSKQVRMFIENKFQKTYTKSGCIALLRQLGFRYKQTSILPSKMNAEHQAEFKKNYEVFSENIKEDETIVFMDGMHPVHNLETGRAWIKVGEKKEVLTNSGRQRCNLNGFYNPHTQDVFAKNYPSINAESVIDSFRELALFYPNKSSIYVVIDNARYYKNKTVKKWLNSSRIELVFLPPYSPNLNLIERFWKCLKKHVILNTYYESFSDFKHALLHFCNKSSPDHKQLLKQSVGTKLHLLKPV